MGEDLEFPIDLDYNSGKNRICFLLDGPDFPEKFKKFRINLRDRLRKIGFSHSFLVEDFYTKPYSLKHKKNTIRKKSFDILHKTHIVFFLLPFESSEGGVQSELEEYFRNVKDVLGACFRQKKIENGREIIMGSEMIKDLFQRLDYDIKFEKFVEIFEHSERMVQEIYYDIYNNNREKLIHYPFTYPPLCEICKKSYSSNLICLNRKCSIYFICKKDSKGKGSDFRCPRCNSDLISIY